MKSAWERLLRLLVIIGAILLIHILAMQFTEEVDWDWADFILAFLMLIVTGGLIELFISRVEPTRYRYMLIALVVLCFLALWMELAVGLFGSTLASD